MNSGRRNAEIFINKKRECTDKEGESADFGNHKRLEFCERKSIPVGFRPIRKPTLSPERSGTRREIARTKQSSGKLSTITHKAF